MPARSSRSTPIIAGVLLLTVATAAAGQNCPGGTGGTTPVSPLLKTQDVCQLAIDVFRFVSPQLASGIAGGNAMLGAGGTLGGIGKFAIGVRGTVVAGSAPIVAAVNTGSQGRFSNVIPTTRANIPGRAVDAGFGVFRGFSDGTTNWLGVDALVSVVSVPERDYGSVAVRMPEGTVKVGYGARFGIVQESVATPGFGLTFMFRDLPTSSLSADIANGRVFVDELKITAASWRLVTTRRFAILGLAGGIGGDLYGANGITRGTAGADASTPQAMRQSTRLMNYFMDASLDLGPIKFSAEAGRATAGSVSTYNRWIGQQPESARVYASVGLRMAY